MSTSDSERPQPVREEPRLSFNALMRYLHAGAAQRAKIVHDQKHPNEIQALYYEAASDVLRRFISGGEQDDPFLIAETSRLAKSASSGPDASKAQANLEVVEAFQVGCSKLDFHGLTPALVPDEHAVLRISGVDVVVRPEAALYGEVKGEPRAGALKLYFSKGHPLSKASAEHGAVILKRYCEEQLARGAKVRGEDCLVCEVRTGEIHHAPTAYARRMMSIEAACKEIALRWPTA
jgi:hypothetical protein